MRYFLDSDFLVGVLRNNAQALNKFKLLLGNKVELYTSSINIHELVKGANLSNDKEKNLQKIKLIIQTTYILSFDKETAFISGRISADLILKGRLIGQNDIFIASMALASDLILVTRNKKHFENILNLKIEEW